MNKLPDETKKVIAKPTEFDRSRIRAVGRELESWVQLQEPDQYSGSRNNWEFKIFPLPCKRLDIRMARIAMSNGGPVKIASKTIT